MRTKSFRKNAFRSIATTTALMAARVHAVENNTLKVGLIGCGSRGCGAAINTLEADPNVELYAVGDAFRTNALAGLEGLTEQFGQRINVAPDRIFEGLDSFKQVIPLCDVILLLILDILAHGRSFTFVHSDMPLNRENMFFVKNLPVQTSRESRTFSNQQKSPEKTAPHSSQDSVGGIIPTSSRWSIESKTVKSVVSSAASSSICQVNSGNAPASKGTRK